MAPLPADTHIGRVRLRVGDLERALAFYRDVLGLNVSREEGSTLTLGDVLVLEEHPGIERAGRDSEQVAGLAGWELRVPDGSARKALIERLTAAGALVPSSNGVTARDPDAIAVEISGSA